MRRAAKVDDNQAEIVYSRPNIVGKNNPNYKNAGWRICVVCNSVYKSYQKNRLFCSQKCCGKSDKNIEKLKLIAVMPRKKRKVNGRTKGLCEICNGKTSSTRTKTCSKECRKILFAQKEKKKPTQSNICNHCGDEFFTYPSKQRQFCSYPCFVKSGGTIRAGLRSSEIKMRYGAKKDANHDEIVEYLESKGVICKDLSSAGRGIPDLVVWAHNEWHLVEIKNKANTYGRKGLNKNQRAWINGWTGGPVYLVHDTDEASHIVSGDFAKLQSSSDSEMRIKG